MILDEKEIERQLTSVVLIEALRNVEFHDDPDHPGDVIAVTSFNVPVPLYLAKALPRVQLAIAGKSKTYEEMSVETPSIDDLVSKLSIEEREEIARLSLNSYIDFGFRALDPKDVSHVCIAIRRILADVLHLHYHHQEFVDKMKEWQFANHMPCTMGILTQRNWNPLNSIPYNEWKMSELWSLKMQRIFTIVKEQGRIFRDMILEIVKTKSETKCKSDANLMQRKI